MAKVKYRIREFKPTANQTGGHSVYAEAVVDNIITNKELARKVESRTGMRAYEVLTALSAVAEIILEETAENNRIQLEADGGALDYYRKDAIADTKAKAVDVLKQVMEKYETSKQNINVIVNAFEEEIKKEDKK